MPIHPEVSFDILSYRNALLHYVMYFNLRKNYHVIKLYESHSSTYITYVVCTYEQCFYVDFLLFHPSSLSLTYPVLKV